MNNRFDDDSGLVSYLRSFRPVEAPPLNLRRPRTTAFSALAVATAAAMFITVMAVRFSYQEAAPSVDGLSEPSSVQVGEPLLRGNRAAEMSDANLELALARASRKSLPRTDRPNSALSVLAREE